MLRYTNIYHFRRENNTRRWKKAKAKEWVRVYGIHSMAITDAQTNRGEDADDDDDDYFNTKSFVASVNLRRQ